MDTVAIAIDIDNNHNEDNTPNCNATTEKNEKLEAETEAVARVEGAVPVTATVSNEEDINIMKIFKKFKCSRIILSYLRLSHIVGLTVISKTLHRVVNKYYGDCKKLDLSEYYGVIGSTEFDHQSFMNDFLPKFKCVQSLSLRYCSHLKVVHLDNIFKALSMEQDASNSNDHENDNTSNTNIAGGQDDEHHAVQTAAEKLKEAELDHRHESNLHEHSTENNESKTEEQNDEAVCFKNEKIRALNLYFCSKLNSRALWKISSRLTKLEYLNLARCYAITADANINGLKLLASLPLKELSISLDPSIQKAEAIDIYSLLIDEDSFRSLKVLDLSHGCEVLHEIEDLEDLTQIRKIKIIKPIKHNK